VNRGENLSLGLGWLLLDLEETVITPLLHLLLLHYQLKAPVAPLLLGHHGLKNSSYVCSRSDLSCCHLRRKGGTRETPAS